jgi:Asp-tRNA(Asn)/Glu-tRNA(Gln) amidotransferase C subunit
VGEQDDLTACEILALVERLNETDTTEVESYHAMRFRPRVRGGPAAG